MPFAHVMLRRVLAALEPNRPRAPRRCPRRHATRARCLQAVDVKALEREALWTAVVSFPLMVMAAVGLDVALVIVSLVPRVAFFIGFESIMPAYYAYRLLVEVVLEAVPQVRWLSGRAHACMLSRSQVPVRLSLAHARRRRRDAGCLRARPVVHAR